MRKLCGILELIIDCTYQKDGIMPEPTTAPFVKHHMTIGQMVDVLGVLPQNAILHGDPYRDDRGDYYPGLEVQTFRRLLSRELGLELEMERSETPVTVGEFREFLMGSMTVEIEGENEMLTANSYVYIDWLVGGGGCVNGVRMNGDGSFTLSHVNPWI